MSGTRHLSQTAGFANGHLETFRLKFSKGMFNRELAAQLAACAPTQALGFFGDGNAVLTASVGHIFPRKHQVKSLRGSVSCQQKDPF